MSKCFVIMPITTPERLLSTYHNDSQHFAHVLEHLFTPALKELNFEVIPPTATGADLIQAEIIRNLEESDLVLCDMSALNPNVFFEFGIRTDLNKPVCIVKDDETPNIPFDTGIINFHPYLSGLAPWTLEEEVRKLTEHINESINRSNGNNALWRYFGLTTFATPPEHETGADAKLDLLSLQVEALGRRLEESPARTTLPFEDSWPNESAFSTQANDLLRGADLGATPMSYGGGSVTIHMDERKIPGGLRDHLHHLANQRGLRLSFRDAGE